MAFLIEGQGEGLECRDSTAGVGTFLDPRVGTGSAVTPNPTLTLVEADGDGLRYRLPRLDVAIFSAPYADAAGNIEVTDAACLTEIHDSARAVHRNGGKVVAGVRERAPGVEAYVPTEWVDAIVVNPRNEQTASVPQRHPWPMFTVGGHVDAAQALADIRFVNDVLHVTPRRSDADAMLARLAATVMVRELHPGALVNIGVGLAEEASKLMYAAGINDDLHQTTETGVYGGVPTSGMFFGAAVNPEKQMSSSAVFHLYEKGLDLACLGLHEVDGDGNVNVSRRGAQPVDYVGPGGFTNITHSARTIVFIGAFAAHAKMHIVGDELVLDQPGEATFRSQVQEVTFNGRRALERGQHVWYVTHLGVFRLTQAGLELVSVTPGIDAQRDIINRSGGTVVLP